MEDKKRTAVIDGSSTEDSNAETTFSIKTSELPLGISDDAEVGVQDSNLSRAKLLWYLGDWDALAKIEVSESSGSQYGLLCLMKAAAFQQTGDVEGTLEYATLAKQNNVDSRLFKQILVGGLYHSLGRAHTIKGDYKRANTNISQALSLVEQVEDPQSGILSRIAREVSTHGSTDLAVSLVKQNIPRKLAALRPTELSRRLDELTLAISSMKSHSVSSTDIDSKKQLITPGDVLSKRAEKAIVLIAGMRHSGSTALFNIIRIASHLSGLTVKGVYSEKITSIQELLDSCQILLIKTHEYRDDIADLGSFTFTTIRDLRDSVASAKRRNFPILEKVGGVVEYAKYNRSIHDTWSKNSDFIFEYEEFMRRPFQVIQKVLAALDLDISLVDQIYEEVTSLPTDNYDLTLLSDTHVTDPKRNLNYATSLNPGAVIKIENQHKSWLERYGYIEPVE
jgi:hypothetical protein